MDSEIVLSLFRLCFDLVMLFGFGIFLAEGQIELKYKLILEYMRNHLNL